MKAVGIVIIASALLIAGIGQFANCAAEGKSLALQNGKTAPMKCLWTAQAELATGGALLVLGVVTALSKRKESQRDLGIMGLTLGAVTMLLPTVLIGVCADMSALCNQVERPAMILLGGIVMIVSAASLLASFRRTEALA
jgi:hypothetical protein